MTTGVICTPPILQFTFNNGQPAAGGSILTQVGGVNAATYQDSGLTTPLPNPIPLNSRGEVSDATGNSRQLFLTPNQIYTFTLSDAGGNLIWQATYVNGVQIAQTAAGIGAILYPQTTAESAALVTPSNFAYPPGNLLRYGADPTGVTDSTAAINRWLSVSGVTGVSLYAPAGTYLTSGGHTINAKQDIYGDGIQRTIFQHTSTGNILFSIPLYGSNQATVEFGGNRFRDFSCVGQGPTNASEIAWYVKNKTDVKWDHIEITGFGYGVQGARDNAANSCTDLTFIACRVLNCGYALWAPLAWNSCSWLGGCWEGSIWSMVIYDASNALIQTNVQTATGASGAIFAAGCQGCVFQVYAEGVAATLAFLPVNTSAFIVLSDGKDITNTSNPGGIALQHNKGNRVQGGVFGSGVGVNYACLQYGGNGCSYESLSGGSGVTSGVVYLTTGTTGNFIGVNWSNAGTNAAYQAAPDQPNNFETSLSSGVSHFGTIDTGSVYLDGGNTSDTATLTINGVGYQGGTTHFRRLNIADGKGNVLLQVDGQNAQINLAVANLLVGSLPTSNPGVGSNKVWVNGGVLTRA